MFNAKEVLLGICKNDEYNTEEWKLINLCLLVGKVYVSKHKYGTPSHLKSLFDNELMIRKKTFLCNFCGTSNSILSVKTKLDFRVW